MFRKSVRTLLMVIGAALLLGIVAVTCWAVYQAGVRLAGVSSQVVPEEVDAGWLREEFSLPEEIALVSLWRSDDTPGWVGRRELRMVAEFRFSQEQWAAFHSSAAELGWLPEPLPEFVANFPKPPVELPSLAEGLSYCTVTYFGSWVGEEWRPGGSMETNVILPCREYPSQIAIYGEEFNHYRVGVLDITTGQVWVVLKNYY